MSLYHKKNLNNYFFSLNISIFIVLLSNCELRKEIVDFIRAFSKFQYIEHKSIILFTNISFDYLDI